MATIENIPYDEISIGQTAEYSRTLSEDDITLFAHVSGDVNPVHLDENFASNTPFKKRIAHGAYTGSVVSAALALKLPGPGTIYLGQSLSFRKPVYIGDTLTVHLTVTDKKDDKKFVSIDCKVVNQSGSTVAKGTAEVMAPTEKLSLTAPSLPKITLQ